MWNSLRSDDEYKDQVSCIGVDCARCPLTLYCPDIEHTGVFRNAQIAIKIVTDWAKDNPTVTHQHNSIETKSIKKDD